MKALSVIVTIALVAIALLAVGLIVMCYSQIHLESISIWPMDPLWASVIVTVVLVGINVYYAWQSRRTIAEMEIARKAEFMPHVKASLSFIGPVFLVLGLTNFGKGPAIDVKATITFSPSNETRFWEQHVMSPSESIRIFLPEGNIDKVCEKAARISVKGKYTDIFGQHFEVDEVIDTKDFIEKVKQLKQLVELDLPRLVRGIKEEISKVNGAVERIEAVLRRGG